MNGTTKAPGRLHRWIERKIGLVFGIVKRPDLTMPGVGPSHVWFAVLRGREGYVNEIIVGRRSFYFCRVPE